MEFVEEELDVVAEDEVVDLVAPVELLEGGDVEGRVVRHKEVVGAASTVVGVFLKDLKERERWSIKRP